MNLFTTRVTDKAKELVQETLDSTFLSEGKRVEEFEKALAAFGLKNPVTVNSGTSALHLALICAGVESGDEVILPAQTFIATGLAIKYVGAIPVFADIDPRTGNLDPERLADKITKRTRAIVVVHWGGYPADLDEINEIAGYALPRIPVIEDAAHAFGASYWGIPIGLYSDATCFSFQAIKPFTTGDGGAVCFKDDKWADRARKLRWFGIDRHNDLPNESGERQYSLTETGFKFQMNDVDASIGIGNLESVQADWLTRRNISKMYRYYLSNCKGLTLMDFRQDRVPSYWLFPLLAERRDDLLRKLHENDIPASVIHQRIDRHPLFGGVNADLKGQEYFDSHQLHLPIHADLSMSDVNRIIDVIREGW